MMKRAATPEKSSCCESTKPRLNLFVERSKANLAEESSLPIQPALLTKCSLMDLPLRAPGMTGGAGEQERLGKNAPTPPGPVIQRYVKVGLYEGSLGLDHIGMGVNSEKTKGFSPKSGLGQEAEKGSWVEGEVKEDHDLIDSLTIKTNPRQEARLQAAMNRSGSASQKFHLYQHNCAQHGAQILNSAGLGVKSSPMPRAFFEGLKRQYEPGQEAEGNPVQGKFKSQSIGAEPKAEEPRPNRTGMPDRLKAGIESLSGIDMSDVRVHANSDRSARLNALAYTQGNQIYLGPGQERHLAHEAWHAVQQKQGRVRATGQMSGVGLNDEGGLEREVTDLGIASVYFGQNAHNKISPFNLRVPLNLINSKSEPLGQETIQRSESAYEEKRSKKEKMRGRASTSHAAVEPQVEDNTHLDELDLSKCEYPTSGKSGIIVLLSETFAYKLFTNEVEYTREVKHSIQLMKKGAPVSFYKALGKRKVKLPNKLTETISVLMMYRVEPGKTYMLAKAGAITRFMNIVDKFKNNEVQLKNLKRWFEAASDAGVTDPQFVYQEETNSLQFIDIHLGGLSGGGYCRQIVDHISDLLIQLKAEANNMKGRTDLPRWLMPTLNDDVGGSYESRQANAETYRFLL